MEKAARLKKVKDAVAEFDFNAREWKEKEMIIIINKKGDSVGHVKSDGTVIQKKLGSQVLMGSLVRNAIQRVL
jgi:hypothetical protein